MVYIDLRCSIILIVLDAVHASMIFFTGFTFMHFVALDAVWAYYLPDTFLCPVIVFATFGADRNAHIITTIIYVPT